ncbi:N-6 DNA methylase [Vibrio ruber]|uniref:N-6 DNA methylase n=1 Tax=Vibrio ruber TaxID=184755 RepID=UPI002893384A|nr:N-6 DNA methylase [Vibrio ruber]WNJ97342.1 N-6 DNA methylase [Vibrio ruber]
MDNIELKLFDIIELIRRDSGVSNIKDSVEQFSLLFLIKLLSFDECYEKNGNDSSFNHLVDVVMSYERYEKSNDFSLLKNIFGYGVYSRGNYYGIKHEDLVKLLNAIPLRIHSQKILEHVLYKINEININDDFSFLYQKFLTSVINDSTVLGEFYSPEPLVSTIVKVIKPDLSQSLYDPAMGTGSFFIEFYKQLAVKTDRNLFYGQDVSPFAFLIGCLNFILNKMSTSNISLDDTLKRHDDKTYDIILSAIPFGKSLDTEQYKYYSDGFYSQNIELMFLHHVMDKLATGGKAALIVPDGLLFNSNRTAISLRRKLLTEFNLYSILSLPVGALFPLSSVKTSVIFFENKNPENEIWFYKLTTNKPINKNNKIVESDFEDFIEHFSSRDVTKNSCLISNKDILRKDDYSLSIALPEKNESENFINISDEVNSLNNIKKDIDEISSGLKKSLSVQPSVEFFESVKIEDVFKTKTGKMLTKNKIQEEGIFPVYGGNGVIGYCDECNLDGENILIGRVGANCGNIHYVKGPIWLTNNSFSVHVYYSGEIFLPYLAHVLRTMDLNSYGRGSAQPSISYPKIKDLEISLPSYQQQVELSDWFDKLQSQKDELLKIVENHTNKINDLVDYSISSKCNFHR